MVDKVASKVFRTEVERSSQNTGGLVQEFDHLVLPSIKPIATFLLTFVAVLPCICKLLIAKFDKYGWGCKSFVVVPVNLYHFSLKTINTSSVHKINSYMRLHIFYVWLACARKSNPHGVDSTKVKKKCPDIFKIKFPSKMLQHYFFHFSLLSMANKDGATSTLFLSVIGSYSLFPLLFNPELTAIKVCFLVSFIVLFYITSEKSRFTTNLNVYEIIYLYGFLAIFFYEEYLQYILGFDRRLPFLPLLIVSVYCSLGVTYFWLSYYCAFLLDGGNSLLKKKKGK